MKAVVFVTFCVLLMEPQLSEAEPFAKALEGHCRSGFGKRASGSFTKYKFNDIQRCRDECLKKGEDCTGIEYHTDKYRCEVHKKTITHSVASSKQSVVCEVRCGPLVNSTCNSSNSKPLPRRPSNCKRLIKYGDGKCSVSQSIAKPLVGTVTECAKSCGENLNCFAFGFRRYGNVCSLYGTPKNGRMMVIPARGHVCFGVVC